MKKAGKPKTPRGQNGKNYLPVSKSLDFVAVDVETANSNVSSICQVGIAVVRSAEIKDVWTQFIDPHDFFDPYNIAIHGIDHKVVSGYPRFEELCDKISRHLGEIVVSHTFFDRRAISKAFEECGKSLRYGTWVDSAQVARRAWPDKYALRGYNLENIARDLGIHFRHHDAGEDARVAAEIVLRAYADTTLETNKQ
jgi:DNA polymerase-3 subunit epsilon